MVTKTTKKIPQGRPAGPASKGLFWTTLPRPFFVLAPMANVTDFAFRSMIAKYGNPDVMWTEFVSADGLNSLGKERLLIDLKFSEKERPIVAQLFTGRAEAMKKAVRLCAEMGFDGVDINMGCPDRAVEKQGGGAAMIKDPKKALEVLMAAREGWKEIKKSKVKSMPSTTIGGQKFNSKVEKEVQVPISIKTRIGYNKVDWGWLRLLLEQELPALTVHLRTRKEMSDVPAHWELMPEIVKLRDEVQKDIPLNERTLIIGNGDVVSVVDGNERCNKYGCDGVMIGRGIFGTPWLFENKEQIRAQKSVLTKENSHHSNNSDIRIDTIQKTPHERLAIMLEHTKLFEKTYCTTKKLKNFAVMKKHFKAYVSGWDGAKELRVKLMEADTFKDVKRVVDEYLAK